MRQELRRGSLPIDYKTLNVHQQGLPSPDNDWTMDHILQGFSWRAGSVGFRTLDPEEFIEYSVLVDTDQPETFAPSPAAVRIIRVPFEVGTSGIEITSLFSDPWSIDMPPGHYALYFSVEPDEEITREIRQGTWKDPLIQVAWIYHLTFVPVIEPVQPAILRADDQITPPQQLVMDAEPA